MSHVRITIDGTIAVNDNLSDWQARPPEYLKRMMDSEAGKNEPYIKAVGITMADALLTGHDVAIDVKTDGDNWSMDVSRSLAIALPASGVTSDHTHTVIH